MSKTMLMSREGFWSERPCLEGLVELSSHWDIPSIRIPSWAHPDYYCGRRAVGTGTQHPSHNIPPVLHIDMSDTNHPYLYWFVERCEKHRCTIAEFQELLSEWNKAMTWDDSLLYCFGAVLENFKAFSIDYRRLALAFLQSFRSRDEWAEEWAARMVKKHGHIMD